MTRNNSSKKDEEHTQAQNQFQQKIYELLELLKKLSPELLDDENHGFDNFCHANIMQMVCFSLPKHMFCDV